MPSSPIAIVFAFIATLLMATFPGWHKEENDDEEGSAQEVKNFPNKTTIHVAFASIGLASAFGCASAFWQHIGASVASTMTRHLTNNQAITHTGTIAMVFAWLGTALCSISAVALLVMIMSYGIFEEIASNPQQPNGIPYNTTVTRTVTVTRHEPQEPQQ
jgi:hypothetical protein